jgi:hypothetical protein
LTVVSRVLEEFRVDAFFEDLDFETVEVHLEGEGVGVDDDVVETSYGSAFEFVKEVFVGFTHVPDSDDG